MKPLLFLLFAIGFTACKNKSTFDRVDVNNVKIQAAAENPCVKCTQDIQAELANCLKDAGSDEQKKSACNKKYSERWVRECQALCTPGNTLTETPRMKCLREAQEAHLKCLAGAKTDAEKSKCNKELTEAIAKCPPPSPNGQ